MMRYIKSLIMLYSYRCRTKSSHFSGLFILQNYFHLIQTYDIFFIFRATNHKNSLSRVDFTLCPSATCIYHKAGVYLLIPLKHPGFSIYYSPQTQSFCDQSEIDSAVWAARGGVGRCIIGALRHSLLWAHRGI